MARQQRGNAAGGSRKVGVVVNNDPGVESEEEEEELDPNFANYEVRMLLYRELSTS